MLNGFAKAYNRMPKEGSKSQKMKAKNTRVFEKVGCIECGKTDVTLYAYVGNRYCKEHKPE